MSLDSLEWSQIDSIQMSVQTADLFILNKSQNEQLSLSCTLLTIARGKCNVEIKLNHEIADDVPHGTYQQGFLGRVIIPRYRPIMQCEGVMCPEQFRTLTEKFMGIASIGRPITLTLYLDDKLSVSVNGDLYIEETREISIKHIDFIFPLR